MCARVPGAVALVLLDRFSTAYRGTQMVAAIVLMVSEQELRGEHGPGIGMFALRKAAHRNFDCRWNIL